MTTKLYPGIAFSPVAELTDNVGAGDTIIPVSNVEAFPPAPNLATIGTDEEGETILYAAKTAAALSGCTRGVEGTARAWSAGEPIARNWTAKDHGDLITAVEGAAEAAQNTQDALAEHQADASAHGELFAAKQPKLTGAPGQVVGFSAQGAAQAVQGWSNPNLLDNWYFADPINQRGQTEYIGNADPIYTLDRWKLAGLSTSSAKLELVDGGVRITSGNAFCQIVENNVTRALIGKTVTVSALMDIETPPVAWQIGIVADNVWIGSTPLPKTAGTDILVSATISIGNVSTLIPWIYSAPDGVYKLKAIKLEQGPVQTLAHQDADGNWVLNDPPPNKALELAKCQRYFEVSVWNVCLAAAISAAELRFVSSYYYKAEKRVAPSVVVSSPKYGQTLIAFDTVNKTDLEGLEALEPIAWNNAMFSPRVRDPQSRFAVGRIYQVIVPDNQYHIDANL